MLDPKTYIYEPDTTAGQVRLLLNDIPAGDPVTAVFTDMEIDSFLTLEGNSVKRAAAQAIDTNATNEALASKVFRTQDLQVDGAKLADAMRKHADRLREQADRADELGDDAAFFEFIPGSSYDPELTGHPLGL